MANYYNLYLNLKKVFRNDAHGLDLLYDFHDTSLDYSKYSLDPNSASFEYQKDQELFEKVRTAISNLNEYIHQKSRQNNTAIRPLPMPNTPSEILDFFLACYKQQE